MNNPLVFVAEFAGTVAVVMILALSPAFKRRPLIFQFPRREGLVSLSLFALVALAWWGISNSLGQQLGLPTHTVNPLLLGPFGPARTGPLVFEVSDLIYQAALAALLAAPFIIALLIRRQPLLSVGLAQRLLRPSLSLGFALGLMSIFLQGKLSKIVAGVSTSMGYALVAALLIGLAEEFVFRGFIQLRLSGWLGDIQGWLASTGLFVVWRLLIAVLAGASFASLGLTLVYLLAFSLLQGWMMRKCNHIAAPAIFHAIHIWISLL